MAAPLFALVDCNNFYPSCERVFNPKLEGHPVIVLSNNDGCIIARSNEAKALGFPMGEPYHFVKALAQKNKVTVLSSNYALYGDMSRRVMTTLAQHAPEVEIYSIDEAFMNLHGISAAADFARHVRSTVRQHTGIPVSIGIGPTKTLAKIANRLAKKTPDLGGVYDLSHGERETALARVAVGDVWGIGRQWSAWLEEQGIKTACDLMHADAKAIRQKMTVTGERIVYELRGVSCLPLELAPPPQKGVTVSRSFGQLLTELEPIEEALTHFASRAAEKLRKQGLMARQLSIFLETNRFSKTRPIYAKSVSLKLPYPSDYTPELIHYGLQRAAADI